MFEFIWSIFYDYGLSVLQNDFFLTGIALSLMGIIFYQLRTLPKILFKWTKTITTKSIAVREDQSMFNTTLKYVTDNICFMRNPRHAQLIEHKGNVVVNADVSTFVAKLEGSYCVISLSVDESKSGGGDNPLVKKWVIRITTCGGERVFEKITKKIIDLHKNEDENVVKIGYINRWGEDYVMKKTKRSPESLCFDDNLYDDFESSCKNFLNSKDEYRKRGILWKYGICLSGEPGIGKSSIIHTLGSQLDRKIIYINISDMSSDEDIQNRFMCDHSNSIVVLEDIDCLFGKRVEKRKNSNDTEINARGVTLSGLLNCLDGLNAGDDGRIVIMTTNFYDKLDNALVRPGRVDYHLQLPNKPSEETFRKYIENFYDNIVPDVDKFVEEVYNSSNTTAELLQKLQECFLRSI